MAMVSSYQLPTRLRTNGQGLAVPNVGQIGNELEPVDDLAPSIAAAADAKGQDTAVTLL